MSVSRRVSSRERLPHLRRDSVLPVTARQAGRAGWRGAVGGPDGWRSWGQAPGCCVKPARLALPALFCGRCCQSCSCNVLALICKCSGKFTFAAAKFERVSHVSVVTELLLFWVDAKRVGNVQLCKGGL